MPSLRVTSFAKGRPIAETREIIASTFPEEGARDDFLEAVAVLCSCSPWRSDGYPDRVCAAAGAVPQYRRQPKSDRHADHRRHGRHDHLSPPGGERPHDFRRGPGDDGE